MIKMWGKRGTAPGQFNQPDRVTVAGGHVYVSDPRNRRFQKFTPDGRLVKVFSGKAGSGLGQLTYPMEVAVDKAGNLFVTCAAREHRVRKLAPDGTLITQWGSYGSEPGQFDSPVGIALDSQGHVYVAETGSRLASYRVQKFRRAKSPHPPPED